MQTNPDMLRLTDLPCHKRKTLPFSTKRILEKITDFKKSAHSLTVFLLKDISCDNLAEVAEKINIAYSRDLTIHLASFLFGTMINIDIVRKLGSFE